LECRIAPAAFNVAGNSLSISLQNANESVSFSTDGNTITAALVGGTVSGGGTGVTGVGTATATITSAQFTSITITDASTGNTVDFANSTGAYPQAFTVNLTGAASGNITFEGASTFGATFNGTTNLGSITSALGSSLTLSGTANLALTATGHSILLEGAVSVAGTTSLAANVIDAHNAGNSFTGALQLTAPSVATIFSSGNLNLAASSFNFTNGQPSTISAGGNITQSGALTAPGGSGTLNFSSTGGSITLTSAGNNISQNVAIGLSVTGTNTATFTNSGILDVGNVAMGTGGLTLSAGGMKQAVGTTIVAAGPVSLTVTANNRDILFSNSGNEISGAITVNELTAGNLRDFSLHNASDTASLPTGTAFTTAGDIRNLTLFFDNTGIALPGYNISGNLSVTAGGAISETAGLNIGGNTTAGVLGDYGIDLTNATNVFNGDVSVNAAHSTHPVSVTNSTDLSLGTSFLGRGAFSATAVSGDISESGPLVQEKGALPATFTVTAGHTITLDQSNDFTGNLTFAGAGLTSLTVDNADFQANFAQIAVPATVTDLTVTFDHAAAILPALNLATLAVTAQGIVQASGTSLTISTNATLDAGDFPLNLSGTANNMASVTVFNSGVNDVIINDAGTLDFTGGSQIGSGHLTVTTSGGITESGTITQAGTSGLANGVSFSSTGGSITLANGNAFVGPVSVTVSGGSTASIRNAGVVLTLGTITTGTSQFSATAGSQGIVQDPNSILTLGVASSFTVTGGGSITLGHAQDVFTGALSLNGGSATVVTSGALTLGASNLTGSLNVTASTVSQNNALTVNGTASFTAPTITLTNSGNAFGTLALNASTSATVATGSSFAIGVIKVGSGGLTLQSGGNITTAPGGNIVETSGTGLITLTTPAGSNITLNSVLNSFLGQVAVTDSNNVNISDGENLTFTAASIITGRLTATSGGVLTLPSNLTNLTGLTTSAVSTTVSSNIATSANAITMSGDVTFNSGLTLTSGAGITFNGDVTVNGPLTLTLANNATFIQGLGTLNLGSSGLTILGNNVGFQIGTASGAVAAVNAATTTISMPGNGNVIVEPGAALNVAGSGILTLANGTGSLTISGALGVGFGATNGQVLSAGSGPVQISPNALLIGTGSAGATATPVLSSLHGLVSGQFANSVNATGAAQDFFAGSDIVTPSYSPGSVTIKAGGVTSTNGVATGFLPDGDSYTVKSSLGAASNLATLVSASGQLFAVVRNTTSTAASTLSITTAGGGDSLLPIGGVAVNNPGSVSISAPAGNFIGSITTAGALTALTAHDLIGASATMPFTVIDGGAATSATSITAHDVQFATFDLAGKLSAFKAVSVNGNVNIMAQSFGTITTTGDAAGSTSPVLGAPDPGNFNANLISTTTTSGVALGTAKIAGTLSGIWDLNGSVGKVTATAALNWTLGTVAGANAENGGLLSKVTTLAFGSASVMNLNVSGNVGTLTASSINQGLFVAGSFGTIQVKANTALGFPGNIINTLIEATGSTGNIAIKSLNVAGNFTGSTLTLLDGAAGTILVGETVGSSTVSASGTGPLGNIASITAGVWQGSNVTAATIGKINITGNLKAGIFGNFTGANVVVLSGASHTNLGIGTFSATGSVSNSLFNIESGNMTSFKVGQQLGSTTIELPDATFGTLGSIQAAEWTSGVTVMAKTINTISSTGSPATSPASPLLLGSFTGDTIDAYLNSGTAGSIGSISAKGNFGGTIYAPHGVGSITVGRSVSNSNIVVDDTLTGAAKVGNIGKVTAGAWSSSNLTANTMGTISITGYLTPENTTANSQPGNVTNGDFIVHGSAPKSTTGITSFTVQGGMSGSVIATGFGIKTLTVSGSVGTTSIIASNPTTPAAAAIGAFTAGDINSSTIEAGGIGTLKTTGSKTFALLGNIANSDIAITSGSAAKGGPVALSALTVAGDFSGSLLDAPASVGKIMVTGRINSGNVTDVGIDAGYTTGANIGSITAGAWGQAGNTVSTDLVTQSVGSIKLTGNTHRGFVGTTDNGFFDILGSSGGSAAIGLGTFSATGAATGSLFRVADGNVTSFTVERMISSDLLVGFTPVSPGQITATPTASNWAATNFKLGSFTTTAPFSATDATDSGAFADSDVVAAVLGKIKISGVNPTAPTDATFGIAFRTSAGAAAKGVVTVAGAAPLTPPSVNGQFNYLGLAG